MKKQYFCKICNKEITVYSKSGLCKSHSTTESNKIKIHKKNCNCCPCKSKRGETKGINNPNYKNGKSLIKRYCKNKDCNKIISRGSKSGYCKSCEAKERLKDPKNHPNYKDGRSLEKYYCIDCNTEINYQSALYGKGRCKSCHLKYTQKAPENNPFYGKIHSKETKKKMSLSKIGKNNPMFGKYGKLNHNFGKQVSLETRLHWSKIRKGQNCGNRNFNWKGGITPLAKIIRDSDKYKIWVNQTFKRDNYTCQNCNKISNGDIEVHHNKPFKLIFNEFLNTYSQFSPMEDKETLVRLTENYEPFWDINNGITLCKKCHSLEMSETWRKIKNGYKII
ncbi:MAG: NUMOD3 domain-containing DNA-binding protein [Patescibacteria group bacterium]